MSFVTLFVTIGFVLTFPFSTALTHIFFYSGILFGLGHTLISKQRTSNACRVLVSARSIPMLVTVLLAYIGISSLWSIAPRDEVIEGLRKYGKFLNFFVLYVYVAALPYGQLAKIVRFGMLGFIASMAFLSLAIVVVKANLLYVLFGCCDLTYGYSLGLTGFPNVFSIGSSSDPSFGRNHISQGLFLLVAIMFAIYWQGFQHALGASKRTTLLTRLVLLILYFSALLCLASKTAVIGGLIILSVGVGKVFGDIQKQRDEGLSKSLLRLVIYILLGTVFCVFLISIFEPRGLNLLIQELRLLPAWRAESTQTSLAGRIDFWHVAAESMLQGHVYSLFGWGVGSYAEVYSRSEVAVHFLGLRNQPHSELILLWVQYGILGPFIVLLLLFMALRSVHDKTLKLQIILLLILYFATNSVLWDATEGILLVLGLAAAAAKIARQRLVYV